MADRTRAGRRGLPSATREVHIHHQTSGNSQQSPRDNEMLPSPSYTPSCSLQSQHDSSTSREQTSPSAHGCQANESFRSITPPAMNRDTILQLARLIVSDSVSECDIQSFDLTPLREVRKQPPVTELSLSELDISRIRSDPKLRHDLNFDRDVSFRPNYDGEKGRLKKEFAKQYWAVLSVEFALYMQVAVKRNSTILTASTITQHMEFRLEDMFKTIRDILKGLVREEDSKSIEQMLDVDLLMQQLRNGVCDLVSLGEWLGTVIKGSCSPVRDAFVTEVVNNIHEAVSSRDPCGLSGAIEKLFSILEIMKLDVANHQIRGLRLLMIAQTVQFSQQYFTNYCQTHPKFDLDSAYGWYHSCRDAYLRNLHDREPLSNLQIFGRATIDILANYWPTPMTFVFDHDRIVEYQNAFQVYRAREAIVQTFKKARSRLCGNTATPPSAIDRLLRRVTQLDPSYSLVFDAYTSDPPDEVVIEILRAAYDSAGQPNSLPTTEIWDLTSQDLAMCMDIGCGAGAQTQSTIKTKLHRLVEREINVMQSMDELRMLDYCELMAKADATNRGVEMAAGRKAMSRSYLLERSFEPAEASMRALAVKIAHISVLHWRVWSPMVYERDFADWDDYDTYDSTDDQFPEVVLNTTNDSGDGIDDRDVKMLPDGHDNDQDQGNIGESDADGNFSGLS